MPNQALIDAAEAGDLEAVRAQLPSTTDMDDRMRALFIACGAGHVDIVDELLPSCDANATNE
ncbi:hypothetical protein SPRG_18069, partial [Saprolegnia parasitica CBS 223.65]